MVKNLLHTTVKGCVIADVSWQVVKLPQEIFPTDFNWFPKSVGGKKQNQSELFVLTSTDGMNKMIDSWVEKGG